MPSVTTIASFPTSTGDGASPDGQLFMASNGELLGATVLGGTSGRHTKSSRPGVALPAGRRLPNLSAGANGDPFGLMLAREPR
jgi:hypothetical protein